MPASAFPTTHWSMVLMAGDRTAPEARVALEKLCAEYWFPLYAYVRRWGRTHHEAEDLTQGFFATLLDREAVGRASPERGRFRTFLLSALRNFLTNEWEHANAAKRGGGQGPLPLEFGDAENQFAREPPAAGLTPEQAFDRSWALAQIERALAELGDEYRASGRGELFAALAPVVWGGGAQESLATQAARIGLNEGAIKVAVHRLRKRLRERLEALIAQTVADPAEAADELRYLIAAVGRRGGGM